MSGVTVNLYNVVGNKVGAAVTNTDGVYSFTSTIGAIGAVDTDGNLTDSAGGGLKPGEAFTIRIDNASDHATGGSLPGLLLSPVNTASSATALDDAIDSDAQLASGFPRINVPILAAGENIHTFDVGFYRAVATTTTTLPAVATTTTLPVGELPATGYSSTSLALFSGLLVLSGSVALLRRRLR